MEGDKKENRVKTVKTLAIYTVAEFPGLDILDHKASVTRHHRLFLLPKKHLTGGKVQFHPK